MIPELDIDLLIIKDAHRRCDACMSKYPMLDDSICDSCKINPFKTGETDMETYIKDALNNPTSFGIVKPN